MDPTLTTELEKDLIVSMARGGKKVSVMTRIFVDILLYSVASLVYFN